MTTAVALLILAGAAWGIASIVRRLLRRGIQITYLVPMSPEQEDRMLQVVQLLSQLALVGIGVYIVVVAGSLAGRLAAGVVAVAAMAFVVRRFRKIERAPSPASSHRDSRPG